MLALTGLACSYVASSYYLLRNPQVLHKRKPSTKTSFPKCVHISHRGGSGEAYENTIRAFTQAREESGTDMLELDCHLTADGVVVVLHDGDLKRATGVEGRVAETRFEDLPPLLVNIPLDFKRGRFFAGSVGDGEDVRRIPTLEEVFQTFPDTAVNVDIKDRDPELVAKVSDLIDKYDRHGLTAWGNFGHQTTELCYRTNPKVGLFFSFRRVLVVLLLYYTGLLPFVPLKETHFEIPMPSIMKRMDMKELGTDYMGRARNVIVTVLDKILMRKKLMEHLEARGIQTIVWVLNTEEEFDKAFASGVTGIMTDYPKVLAEYLERHPDYRK